MLTFEESQIALDALIDDLPPEIFRELNCGVSLIPDIMYDANGLIILGQYRVEPRGLGRYVIIFYGSLIACHGHLPPEEFRQQIKHVLHHELIHHLENLAGDRSLEIEDARNIQLMLAGKWRESL